VSAIEELRSYLTRLQRRFQLGAAARGAAILASVALLATVILTVIINRFAFSRESLWSARVALLVTLAMGTAFGLAVPLWRLSRRWWIGRAERAFPQFEQRILTFTERGQESRDPFVELLAADTMRIARGADVRTVAPDRLLVGFAAVGVVSLAALVWLIRAGPGYLGYGAAALWRGAPAAPFYTVHVSPGDATVRRHADQLVTAELAGLQTPLRIHVRYHSASKWEETTMQPQPAATGFQFLFAGIPEDVEYYVQAGSIQTPHFHLRVADIPAVKQIRVTYHHPDWMHLGDTVEEHGGDLRAVQGTQAQLEIVTDRPLSRGILTLDDGREIALRGGPGAAATSGVAAGAAAAGNARAGSGAGIGTGAGAEAVAVAGVGAGASDGVGGQATAGAGIVYRGVITLERNGSYHVAERDRAQPRRISEDYFIEASAVKPPEVAVVRPERDYRASPIEEVTLAATANDPFGLSEFAIHYSVNGGPEKTVSLQKPTEASPTKASGSAMLSLEALKLVPGDVVGFYAVAKDVRTEAHTDISFIQIEPFEREFSQSQQIGGGGGGGAAADDQAQIAEREKDIIAATCKQAGLKTGGAKEAAEQAKFLSDVQNTLRNQAMSLAGRLAMRDLQLANEQFGSFQQDMEAAATAMRPAAQKLDSQQWSAAMFDEQKALQHLLRAEATFRQIEVAFGSRGGGSGSVNSAGRDLASLFDLELDTQKNQYESAQAPSSPGQHATQVDDALKKLDELARRQSELAAQRSESEQTAEERWQQEMLRRKADEIQQQLEQLARNAGQQGGGASSSSDSAQSNGSAGGRGMGRPGANGRASAGARGGAAASAGANAAAGDGGGGATQQALERLRQAEDDMRRAVDEHDPAAARRAAEQLREAMNLLGGAQQQDASRQVESLAREAGRLANQHREQAERMRALLSARLSSQGSAGGQRGGRGLGGSDSLGGRSGNGENYGGGSGTGDGRNYGGGRNDGSRSGNGSGTRDANGGATTNAVDSFIADRQQLADDLARLTQNMRSAERATQERSHGAATKLRDALGDLEQADTETQLQRSADQLRRGYAPLTDTAETEIASELQHLKDQLGEAQQAMADRQPSSDGALDTVERLRSRLAALDQSLRGSGNPGSAGQGQIARQGQLAGAAQPAGPVGSGDRGGNRGGPVNGGWNTGNNSELPRPVAPDTSAPPAYSAQAYQEGMNDLDRLKRSVGDDPAARRQVDDLIRSMQKLDPKRFPGNPAMVDELYARVLSGVDRLELQLRHEPDDAQPEQVRADSPQPVPAGYETPVADYFRRLSRNP
jgi:FtsZ-binding cell division protein ZapB